MSLKSEKENFVLVSKRILKSELSSNPETLARYKTEIIEAHDRFIRYVKNLYKLLNPTDYELEEEYVAAIIYVRAKLLECLTRLGFEYSFENTFELIDLTKIKVIEFENNNEDQQENDNQQNNDNMAPPTKAEFIATYSKILLPFDGKFEELQGFLDSVDLLKQCADGNETTAVGMIKAKLSKRARTCITDADNTIDRVVDRLKNTIKAESSDAIIAKLKNVKQQNKSANNYASEIEKLGDSLKASYISENMSPESAENQATKRVVETIKQNCTNEKVQNVLLAGKFDSISEAVAKFIDATNETSNTASVKFFHNSRRGNHRSNSNNADTNRNFRNNGNSNGYRGNNRNNSNGYNRFNNNSGRNNRGRNNRGGGRGYHNNNNYDNREVRYVETAQGNPTGPQQARLGELPRYSV